MALLRGLPLLRHASNSTLHIQSAEHGDTIIGIAGIDGGGLVEACIPPAAATEVIICDRNTRDGIVVKMPIDINGVSAANKKIFVDLDI